MILQRPVFLIIDVTRIYSPKLCGFLSSIGQLPKIHSLPNKSYLSDYDCLNLFIFKEQLHTLKYLILPENHRNFCRDFCPKGLEWIKKIKTPHYILL